MNNHPNHGFGINISLAFKKNKIIEQTTNTAAALTDFQLLREIRLISSKECDFVERAKKYLHCA